MSPCFTRDLFMPMLVDEVKIKFQKGYKLFKIKIRGRYSPCDDYVKSSDDFFNKMQSLDHHS